LKPPPPNKIPEYATGIKHRLFKVVKVFTPQYYSTDFTHDDIEEINIHKVKIQPLYKGLPKKKVHTKTGHEDPEGG
jgi:hypothetical protein